VFHPGCDGEPPLTVRRHDDADGTTRYRVVGQLPEAVFTETTSSSHSFRSSLVTSAPCGGPPAEAPPVGRPDASTSTALRLPVISTRAGIRRSGRQGRTGGRSRQDAAQRLRPRSRVACDPTKQCWIGGPLERTARRPVPTVRSRSASLQLHRLYRGRAPAGSARRRQKGFRAHVEDAYARIGATDG
jgi:hypothetical protein